MFIDLLVPECDFKDIQYPEPVKGAGLISRGATGRWCIVMYAGPEYLKENNVNVITPEQAEKWIAENHSFHDWCDF